MKYLKRISKPTQIILTIAFTLIVTVSAINAQTSSVDLSFNIHTIRENYPLNNFELQSDGKIVAYGFPSQSFGDVQRNQIARLNADGSLDSSFNCTACDFYIYSIVFQPNGKIIVLGEGFQAAPTAIPKVLRLNTDGSVDNSLTSPFGMVSGSQSSYAILGAVQPDGKILVNIRVSFQNSSSSYVYRLNSDGSFDNSFTTIAFIGIENVSKYITNLRLLSNGKILVGYDNTVYRFNTDGTRDMTFVSPTLAGSSESFTAKIDVQPDDRIIITGKFNSVNSVSRADIVRLLANGSVDPSFAPPTVTGSGDYLNGFEVLPDGKILVNTQPFYNPILPPSVTISRFLRFNSDGSLDNTFNAPNNFRLIRNWRIDAQGKIVVDVSILQNDLIIYKSLRLNTDGSLNAVLNTKFGPVGSIYALATQPDEKVIIGGVFNSIDDVPQNNFARLNADGSVDTTFNSGTGLNVAPTQIVVQPDGKILLGGSTSFNYNGTIRGKILRLNSDGILDFAFNPTIDGFINSIASQIDGKILIAGFFTSVNGQTRNGVARLNSDGSLDAAFNPTLPEYASVYKVVVQSDGKILIGGSFTGVNGSNVVNLARLNSDGTLDATFNAGNIANVSNIQIQTDGKYLVSAISLFRLNSNGTQDTTFQPPVLHSSVFLPQPDGSIIVAGEIVASVPRRSLARLKPNGSLDTLFFPEGSLGLVFRLAAAPNGKVIIAGSFSRIGNVNRIGVARLTINPITPTTLFDFNGDGRADVSTFRPSNGTWFTSTNPALNYGAVQFGAANDKLVPADYDGDGKTDVAVYRDGNWYLNRSSLGFTGIAFGNASDIPIPADYDGDGKADIAVFRPSNGVWYLQQSTVGFTAIAYGLGTDKPVPADYDGDGRADIGVFRPSNGTWYLQRSQLGFTGVQFGLETDAVVPADYDGDGRADIAVFRNGTWYLNRSRDGFTGITFGFGTDTPTPADYDGDGNADVAVFRNGVWYLNRTTAGFTGISFGLATDKPIPNSYVR